MREAFGHSTAGAAYLKALPYLCARAGVPIPKRKHYRLLPDGQPYINPVDDIKAVLMAIAGGLTTFEAEIAKRGGDRNAVWLQRAKEAAEAKKLGLSLDLSGSGAAQTPAPAEGKEKVPNTISDPEAAE